MVPVRQERKARDPRRFLIWVASIALFVACDESPQLQAGIDDSTPVNRWSTDKAWNVLQAQDKRDIPSLCKYSNDSIWQVRRAAALAFASVRSGEAVECLKPALNDREGAVRAAAAFAMGLCGNTDEAEEMVDMLKFEHDETVRYALWEASGRTGDELTMQRLLFQPTKSNNDSLGLAWALYAMALDGIASDSSVNKCLDLLLNNDVGVRLGAAHTLGRTAKELLVGKKKSLAKWLGSEPLSEVRMGLWRAYGKVADKDDLPILESRFAKVNPLEQVSIIRAMRSMKNRQAWRFLQLACRSSNGQVSKTAAQMLSTFDYDINYQQQMMEGVEDPETKLILATHHLRGIGHSKSRHGHWVLETVADSDNEILKAQAQAISMEMSNTWFLKNLTQLAVNDTVTSIERTAASQALVNWLQREGELGKDAILALSELLNSKDPGVLADIAMYIMGNEDLKGKDPGKFGLFAEYSISQLTLPRDLEAKLMLENAIAHLNGEEAPEHSAPAYNHPIRRSRLNALPNGQAYQIETSKGSFKMITFVDEAPGSALVFDSLVTAGYYDGKSYHRVVPNFVAQGGCPRGDGYGSMDWTLRTEIGLSRYTTGSVGLASAGADTESCQFFITHSPTPHLDGRYTRFGQVIEGMAVVNDLAVGDEILSISRFND